MSWWEQALYWFTHVEAEIWWSIPVPFVVGYFFGRWSQRKDSE